jgi:hypothetical protein
MITKVTSLATHLLPVVEATKARMKGLASVRQVRVCQSVDHDANLRRVLCCSSVKSCVFLGIETNLT